MRTRPFLLPAFFCIAVSAGSAFAASTITGTVTNKTKDKPSAGDDVTLIRLAQGMQESTKTKTDAKGHFSLDVPDEGTHLVRVTHDKANYFRPAPPGTTSIELDVFDSAPRVEGVSTEADVFRVESDPGGKTLKVVESFFVKNESSPPRTQFSDRAYEFYLPGEAIIQGSAALGPGGMPVQSAPVPLEDKGHYAFLFPIRPGETHFQVTYQLPYTGTFKFSPRVAMATDNLAVILPNSMKFQPGPSSTYQPINDDAKAQTFLARPVKPGQPLDFTLSGTGQMPRETQGADAQNGPGGPAPGDAASAGAPSGSAASDTRPGGGLGNPIDTPDPLHKYRWWILTALVVLLAGAAGILLRKPGAAAASPSPDPIPAGSFPASSIPASSIPASSIPASSIPASSIPASSIPASSLAPVPGSSPSAAAIPGNFAETYTPPPHQATYGLPAKPAASNGSHSGSLLAALKDELFSLETERISGTLDEAEYARQKSALEIVLKRALTRQ